MWWQGLNPDLKDLKSSGGVNHSATKPPDMYGVTKVKYNANYM